MATETIQQVNIPTPASSKAKMIETSKISRIWEAKNATEKLIFSEVFVDCCPGEPIDPITVGPNGSGYKGPGKSHDEYARDADLYGYNGSYNGSNRGQRELAGLPRASNPAYGETRGRGGGGNGPGGGDTPDLAAHPLERRALPEQRVAYYEWVWACVKTPPLMQFFTY